MDDQISDIKQKKNNTNKQKNYIIARRIRKNCKLKKKRMNKKKRNK